MITITEETWRQLVVMGLGCLVLLVAMFVYVVRSARLAYLGESWIRAAGSRRRAVRALTEFEHETEALVVEHAYRWPDGLLVAMDRENVERLIERYSPQKFGGPGL
jgi:hypothetical protein